MTLILFWSVPDKRGNRKLGHHSQIHDMEWSCAVEG